MNYDKLTAEIKNDPAGRGYSAMSHEEAAASVNARDIPVRKLVPLWNVKKTAIETNCWLAIKAAAAAHAVPEVQGAAAVAVDYIDDQRFENLDMDLPSTQAMLGALVAGGVLTQDQADTLDALADDLTSRAIQLELSTVGPHHVEYARAN